MSQFYNDYEIQATNFNHPTITTGQHTNGPAMIWVRYKGGEWLCTNETKMHRVRRSIEEWGAGYAGFLGLIASEQP